jgi:hypothetical protein
VQLAYARDQIVLVPVTDAGWALADVIWKHSMFPPSERNSLMTARRCRPHGDHDPQWPHGPAVAQRRAGALMPIHCPVFQPPRPVKLKDTGRVFSPWCPEVTIKSHAVWSAGM